MRRALCAIGAGALLLAQSMSAIAATNPSPPLDGLLVSPPGTGFVEDKGTPGFFEGPFDAAKYAEITASDADTSKKALDQDGFLSGFGRTWVRSSLGHLYVEAVMAFKGSKGAKAWLRESEAAGQEGGLVPESADPCRRRLVLRGEAGRHRAEDLRLMRSCS